MLKIIAIDDSKIVHRALGELLSGNAELIHFYDAQDALKAFQEGGIEADLILLDWEMPIMSGPEFLKASKDLTGLPPVVMVTSKNKIEDIKTATELGAREYVMKPFCRDILLEKINLSLETKKAV